jgi:pilus assembly protein FimV
MIRKFVVTILAFVALGSGSVHALSLGEITSSSALYEPLEVQLQLSNVGDVPDNDIALKLINPAEGLSDDGVERVLFLNTVQFSVERDGNGSAVVFLSSEQPVKESELNFLLELSWPKGRLLREYTLTFSKSPSVVAPVSDVPTQLKEKTTDTVRVKTNDTLWSIAQAKRPNSSVSVREIMLAILTHNPDAFIDSNINLLKDGEILRIPELREVRRVTSRHAVEELAHQQELQESEGIVAADEDDNTANNDVGGPVQGGLLKLVAISTQASDGEVSNSASGGSSDETSSGNMAGEGPAEQRVVELTAEVEGLNKKLQNLQRQLTLMQEEFALLQLIQAEETLTNTEVIQEVLLDEAVVPNAEELAQKTEELTQDTVVAETAAGQLESAALEVPAEAKSQEPSSEQRLVDVFTNNPLYIALLIVAAMGLLVLLGAPSRRDNEQEQYPEDLRQAIDDLDKDIELNFNDQDLLVGNKDDATQRPVSESIDDQVLLADTDESTTKLELARAYIDMADQQAAQELLHEVLAEGSDQQQQEAKKLLDNLL